MARAEKAIDPADFAGIPRTRGATNEYPLTVSAGKLTAVCGESTGGNSKTVTYLRP